MINKLKRDLRKIADSKRAKVSQRYFKTGKGEYGEGDKFLGITVPQSRKIAIKFKDLSFSEITKLLHSEIHEERLIALLILVFKFDQTNKLENVEMNEKIFNFYLQNTKYINNWDLVDLSADKIMGGYLFSLSSSHSLNDSSEPGGNTRPARKRVSRYTVGSSSDLGSKETVKSSFREESHPNFILAKLAKSKNLWERRIAALATFQFIKYGRFNESLMLAKILLHDKHDLMRKAVGWMLREIGKKDMNVEVEFLNKYYKKMPRTMLRYAIERFPKILRTAYLQGKI